MKKGKTVRRRKRRGRQRRNAFNLLIMFRPRTQKINSSISFDKTSIRCTLTR